MWDTRLDRDTYSTSAIICHQCTIAPIIFTMCLLQFTCHFRPQHAAGGCAPAVVDTRAVCRWMVSRDQNTTTPLPENSDKGITVQPYPLQLPCTQCCWLGFVGFGFTINECWMWISFRLGDWESFEFWWLSVVGWRLTTDQSSNNLDVRKTWQGQHSNWGWN